ncbi:hypothetical protein [uncultured Nostoc sp.]|uniref:hypothetical protein n=1 Tax=uncultured Nostoc sp. TaxID=340711 RepID=UPI0035C99441
MVTKKSTTPNRSQQAKAVAAKIAETINNGLSSNNIHDNSSVDYSNTTSAYTASNSNNLAFETVTVPGLREITPNTLTPMIPHWDSSKYRIEDPLNPSETIPQLTQQQAERATTIYEGAIRALEVTGKALDVTKEKFTVIGKHARVIGQGISASTEVEKVKGLYLGYLNEVENTNQKNVELGVNQAKSVTTSRMALYSKDELQSQEKIAASKAEIMRLKDVELQAKLNEFKLSLGYLTSSN